MKQITRLFRARLRLVQVIDPDFCLKELNEQALSGVECLGIGGLRYER